LVGIGFFNSLASNGTTLYYTLETSAGIASTLYTIDSSTGTATKVGPTGTATISGSAFAGPTFATGQLYGFTTTGNTEVINLSTGAATFLNRNGLTDIFGGVGIVTAAAIPEPSSLLTLALGVGCVAMASVLRRAKRRPGPRGIAGRS
jgi:hypothetical protein